MGVMVLPSSSMRSLMVTRTLDAMVVLSDMGPSLLLIRAMTGLALAARLTIQPLQPPNVILAARDLKRISIFQQSTQMASQKLAMASVETAMDRTTGFCRTMVSLVNLVP